MTSPWQIRRVTERDKFGAFESGNERLTVFFRQYAKQHQRKQFSATYVALEGSRIVAAVTLTSGSIELAHLPEELAKPLPRYAAHPVLTLARMATDAPYRGKGIGSTLMSTVVFPQTRALAKDFGCIGIFTDAKTDATTDATGFYKRFHFVDLSSRVPPEDRVPDTTPMFLPLAAVP